MRRAKAKHIIEVLIHLAFWIGVYYTLIAITSSSVQVQVSHGNKDMERMAIKSISPNSPYTLIFLLLVFYGNIFWIFKWIIRHRRLSVGIAFAAGWLILNFAANYIFIGPRTNDSNPLEHQHMAVIYAQTDVKVKHKGPLKTAVRDTIRAVGKVGHIMPDPPALFDLGNTTFRMQLTMLLVFLAAAGLSVAYFFLKEWGRNELARNQLEAYQLSTEIKFLRSQVNPHFLFNTLNNLFSMAQEKGNDDLADGISKLSGMMRYMLYDSNTELVPLKNEIVYIENCILLNKLRYADDEARVHFSYPTETNGLMIAPMLFIAFVENAFKHGVVIGRSSVIDISLSAPGTEIVFSCVNAIHTQQKKMDEGKSGIGLENVKRRLELLYPGKHQLTISNDGKKYSVELRIEAK